MKLFFGYDYIIPADTYEDAFLTLYNYYSKFTMQTYNEFILNSLDSLIQQKNPLAIEFIEEKNELTQDKVSLLLLAQLRDIGITSIINNTPENFPQIQFELSKIYQDYNPDIDMNEYLQDNDLIDYDNFNNLMTTYKNNLIKANILKHNNNIEIETYSNEVN